MNHGANNDSKQLIADQARVHAFRAFKLNTKLMWEASAKLVTQMSTAGGGAVPAKTLESCLRDPREIKKVKHYLETVLRQPQARLAEARIAVPELHEAFVRANYVLGHEKQKVNLDAAARDPVITTYFEAYNLSRTVNNLKKAGLQPPRITADLIAMHAQAPNRILANLRPEQIRSRLAAAEITQPTEPIATTQSTAAVIDAVVHPTGKWVT